MSAPIRRAAASSSRCSSGPRSPTGTYDIPVIDLKLTCVLTNTATIGAYRGAGRPECLLDLERLMDTASRQIGIDPAELRRRNFVKPSQMPYTTAMGEKYDSGDFDLFLTKTLEHLRLGGLRGAQGRGREARQALWPRARLLCRMDQRHGHERDGALRGQGRRQGDDLDGHAGHGPGAADQLHAARLGAARHRSVADRDRHGRFRPGRRRRLDGLALGLYRRLGGADRPARSWSTRARTWRPMRWKRAPPTSSMPTAASPSPAPTAASDLGELAARQPDKRIFIENVNTVDGIAWPNGAHVGEVEIDPETGLVELKRYTTVDDVGRPLHRPIVFGQIQGGCAQGIGQALLEENVYDRETGPAHDRLVHGLRHAAGRDLPDLQQPARRHRCRPRPIRSAPRAWANRARSARRRR